jgi:transcription initiation factor TFIIA small subunit
VHGLTKDSLGGALTDTLDNLITERRIEPQLAMKILINFDKAVADGLAEKVKTRLTFKVSTLRSRAQEHMY